MSVRWVEIDGRAVSIIQADLEPLGLFSSGGIKTSVEETPEEGEEEEKSAALFAFAFDNKNNSGEAIAHRAASFNLWELFSPLPPLS